MAAALGLTVLGVALVLGALGYFIASNSSEARKFSLVDQSGQAVTEQAFEGKLMLVLFGYTFCPDVCPTGLAVMGEVLDMLGPAGDRVVPVFITIDPERDTPAVLKDYIENFHPRMVALSGTLEQVAAAAKTYNSNYLKIKPLDEEEEKAGGYYMGHSTSTYLTGPKGESLMEFDRWAEPEAMAASIGEILQRLGEES